MRHAHVWVEAYMRPQDITQEMIDEGDASPSGAWLRLNPMPLNSEISQINDNNPSVANRANDALGFAQMLWDDFVVGLNAERQQKALFQGSMDKMLEGTYWQTAFNATALGKWSIVSNCSSHKDWATEENSILVDPVGKQPCYDNFFFKEGNPFNQGEYYKLNGDDILKSFDRAVEKVGQKNTEGTKLRGKFTYSKTVDAILDCIYSDS